MDKYYGSQPPPVKAKPKVAVKPTIAEKPKISSKPNIKENKFINELANAISKQPKINKQAEEIAPISEKTCSLTEVSSLAQLKSEPHKHNHELSDTLDFTLSDEGFDVSPCDEQFNISTKDIPQFSLNKCNDEDISEAQFSDNDIDDFLNDLSIIPPPPPIDLDDNDDMSDIFIPPAPPPDLENDFASTDDESQPSAFNDNHKNIVTIKPYESENDNINSYSKVALQKEKNIERPPESVIFKSPKKTSIAGIPNSSNNVQSKLSEVLRSGLNEKQNMGSQNRTLHKKVDEFYDSKETDIPSLNENPSSLSKHTNLFDTSEDASSQSTVRQRKNSGISRTWSSCSSTSDLESKKEMSVNLRKMFLNNMRSYDSDENTSTLDNKRKYDAAGFSGELDTDDDEVDIEDDDDYARLNNLDVKEWTSTDVGDWLELIGLQHLRENFQGAGVDGRTLFNLEYNILDSLVPNEDEKELLLSEVYTLKNPENNADMEISMLEALEQSTGEDREKILAMINTLQDPIDSSYSNGFMHSATASAMSFETQKAVSPQPNVMTPTISIEDRENVPNHRKESVQVDEENENVKMMNLLAARVFDPDQDVIKSSVPLSPGTTGDMDKRKKKSKKGLFSSLRKKNKKSKSNEANSSLLNQENTKGVVSISWLSQTTNIVNIKLLIGITDASQDVCKMCLEYLEVIDDPNLYQIVISRKDRKVENVALTPSECPLVFQIRWTESDNYQFELLRTQGHDILVKYNPYMSENADLVKLQISGKTTVSQLLAILRKKFNETTSEKFFILNNTATGYQLKNDMGILDQQLTSNGQHIFELINISPEKEFIKNKIKNLEEDVKVHQKNEEELNKLLRENQNKIFKLNRENENFHSESIRLQKELSSKENQIKKLEYEVQNQDIHQKLRSPTPSSNREMKLENMTLSTENKHQMLQIEQLEHDVNNYKEKCFELEEEKNKIATRCRKLESANENLKEKCKNLEESRRVPIHNDNTEKIKKLYTENLEYLSKIRNLEEKLAESESNISQNNHRKEIQDSETIELKKKFDALQQEMMEKDSKLLEYEYTNQKLERDIKDNIELLREEKRKRKKECELKESFEQQYEEINSKIDTYKNQVTEKEKQIQNLKSQFAKQDKKFVKQATAHEKELKLKQDQILYLQSQNSNENKVLEEKIEELQKLLIDKDMMKKKSEFEFNKKTEDMKGFIKEIERKLAAKDVIIDRLENKVAKADLNTASKLQVQEKVLQDKDDTIQRLEMKLAKTESEHASKLREFSSNVRAKDSHVEKLEMRVKKMEEVNRDLSWKHDKQLIEKDRMLKQIYEDRDREVKDLKSRIRLLEEEYTEKEKRQKDNYRKQLSNKETLESRLKKREKEYKQQKHLLEKLLEIVNNKSPALLRELENSLDENRSFTGKRIKSSQSIPLNGRSSHDWC